MTTPKYHGLPFTAEEVLAILDGRKTQTRRSTGKNKPYEVGDRIWVKEKYHVSNHGNTWRGTLVTYAAGGPAKVIHNIPRNRGKICCDRAAVSMPRWASRIMLEITDVRVQRVQEISCGGAMFKSDVQEEGCPFVCDPSKMGVDEIEWFSAHWDSINARRGIPFESNPWVAAYTFRRIEE